MIAAWKLRLEAALMSRETPEVLTIGMLQMLMRNALAAEDSEPSDATFQRWLREMAAARKLLQVIRGVYLNRMGHNDVSPAAASHWIRARSVVSLAWVLEQAGVTNNFGDTITCVIPTDPTWTNPQISDRKTALATFRFFAMPARLVNVGEVTERLDDIQDPRFDYQRSTPEKALMDWIYLGASARSRLTPPPMDLDIRLLDKRRLARLARCMGIEGQFDEWQSTYAACQAAPDVRDNQAVNWRL
jgi:hypothetical protein